MVTIHLPGEREQSLRSVLRAGAFASADEFIDEALRLVGQRDAEQGAMTEADRRRRQPDNLKRLGETLDAMPTA